MSRGSTEILVPRIALKTRHVSAIASVLALLLTADEASLWSDPAFVLDGWVPDTTLPIFTQTKDFTQHTLFEALPRPNQSTLLSAKGKNENATTHTSHSPVE